MVVDCCAVSANVSCRSILEEASSFSPYRRSRTVAGPDTVVEERRIERDLP
jgi:hypothetical protein